MLTAILPEGSASTGNGRRAKATAVGDDERTVSGSWVTTLSLFRRCRDLGGMGFGSKGGANNRG